jgi:hypothetical protein
MLKMFGHPVNTIGIYIDLIVTQLVLRPEADDDRDRETERKADNIYKREKFRPKDTSKGRFEIVLKHHLLPVLRRIVQRAWRGTAHRALPFG